MDRRFLAFAYALVLSLVVGSSALHAQQEQPQPVRELNRIIAANLFTVDRDLHRYTLELGDDFLNSLVDLGRDQTWIDMGSGEGIALEQYLQLSTKNEPEALEKRIERTEKRHLAAYDKIRARALHERARVLGITLKMERRIPNYGPKLWVLKDRLFEVIPNGEIGHANLITDFAGVFSYAAQIDVVLQRYLDILQPNGKIFIRFGPGLTGNTVSVGRERLPLRKWLEGLDGLRVTQSASISDRAFTLRIQKQRQAVKVPKLQLLRDVSTLENIGHQTPTRHYKEFED